jgi:hypothetical protein
MAFAPNWPPSVAILPSSIFPNVQLLVKRLVHQRTEIDPNLHDKSVKVRILIYIDGLLSVANWPKPLLSYLLPFSRTFNALVKRLAGSGAEIDPNLPANKVLLQVAHAFLYTLMDFSRTNCGHWLLSPSSIFPTFNC